MIIEFYGMPGSGKTTILNSLSEDFLLCQNSFVLGTFDHLSGYRRVFLKFIYSCSCFFINPNFYLYNLQFLLKSNRYSSKFFRDFLNITYLFSRYKQFANSEKIVIFDQGFLQAYWSINCFNDKSKEYDFSKIQSQIQSVIIVNLDSFICLERLKRRSNMRSRVEKQIESFDTYYNEFEIIKSLYVAKYYNRILNIDSSKEIALNVEKIRMFIKQK